MNKKVLVVLFIIVVFCAVTFSATKPKKQEPTVKTPPKLSQQEKDELAKKALETLNKRTWTIYLVPQDSKTQKVETDVLTFTEDKLVSQFLSSKGFKGSNYALRIQENKSAVWETVQRDDNDNLAMWRGELWGDSMWGMMSLHYKDGKIIFYDFSTTAPTIVTQKETSPTKKK